MPNSQMAHALDGAKLVGYDGIMGQIVAWYGGYSFNVYDTSSWKEVCHFTSGELCGDVPEGEKVEIAKERMKMSDYEPIHPED